MLERYVPLPLVTRPPSVTRLARRAVLAALSRWRHGHLTLRLPDGEVARFGDPHAPPEARASATVVDERLFARLVFGGELGAGEAYQDELWRADDPVRLLRLFLRNLDALRFDGPLARAGQLASLVGHRLRRNSRRGSESNIHAHYDLGNDFYRLFLDEKMIYSCAIWEREDDTLETAQARKLERVCQKLALGPSDHLLEIGCGWGALAIHAAATRGCRVTAATISREQHRLASERVAAAGLADRVRVVYSDYRELGGAYSRLASIEMFEAVGYDYWGDFFAACSRLLAPGGTFVMQTITMPDQRFDSYRRHVDWTQKHIFPGAVIPALGAMISAMARRSDLVVRHVEDIGPSYAPTLAAWRARFLDRLAAVRALGFDDRFVRTWELYLAWSEACFAERTLGDAQLVLTHAS